MPSFHQPRPRPGFLIDTSASMQDTQLARAVAELGGLTRQLGYTTEVVVACCDTIVHDVRKVFSTAQLELYGGGGTDLTAGLRWFVERNAVDRFDHAVPPEREVHPKVSDRDQRIHRPRARSGTANDAWA